MRRFAFLAGAIAAVLWSALPAAAGVTAYATWNTRIGYAATDAGWTTGYMVDSSNGICADSNPWYTGPSPGTGWWCYWIVPSAAVHVNMQMPSVTLTGGKFGGGLDTTPKNGHASMCYILANALLTDNSIGGTVVGNVRCLNDAEGCVEFFFNPNWVPPDSQTRELIHLYDDSWTLRRSSSGTLTSIIRNANGVNVGHTLTGDLSPEWNHIALAWDATSVRTYLNGVKAGETVYGGSSQKVSWKESEYIFIGGGNDGMGGTVEEMRAADGVYDNLVVWDEVRYTGNTITVPGGPVPPPAPMTIVSAGTPTATIVVSSAAPNVVAVAANDLQAYVQKMSGAVLPISHSTETPGNLILVGRMPEVDVLLPDLSAYDVDPDGFVILTLAERLILTGKSDGVGPGTDCGTPNAVYQFLESLGCRWYMPGEDGEVIPTKSTITVPITFVISKPDFPGRWIGDTAASYLQNQGGANAYDEFQDWLRRNRTGPNRYHHGHNYFYIMRPEDYFATHPEYFTLVDGVRRSGYSQPCTSNAAVVDIFSSWTADYLYRSGIAGQSRSFAVSPNDSTLWCECEPCEALDGDKLFTYDEKEGRTMGLGRGTWRNMANRILLFENQVAERAAAGLADAGYTGPPPLITYYAHYNITGTPDFAPRDNVMPGMCHVVPNDYHWRQHVLGWEDISKQLYYYTYMGWRIAYPKLHIADDIRWCYEHKGLAMYLEHDEHSPLNMIPLYLAAKAMWDVDSDSETVLNEFYIKFYGAGSATMKQFFEVFDAATHEATRDYDCFYGYPDILTQEIASACRNLLSTAYNQATQDVVRRRILSISSYWTVVERHVDARDAMATWRPNRTAANKSSAQAAVNAALSAIDTRMTDFYLEPRRGLLNAMLTELSACSVADRHIFYNNSAWDGDNPAASLADDTAIATDKWALKTTLGGCGGFPNYTSYSRGINGIMVDINNLPGTPTAADFQFKVGNSDNPATWAAAPAPTSITVRPGAGVNNTHRVTIIWPDNAIQNQWLQVTVKPTAATGLSVADVSYFGNAIGECGNSTSDAKVNATDGIAARNDPHSLADPAAIDNPHDFNRDKKVDAADEIISRNNPTNFMTKLQLIRP